uniref:Reverse transcriptase domain-containing protein n=1 Tax=Chromera velia CCMP2878 TaxID=1169474 RepID=A0A0G4H8Y8_9ALVE|eukprot:Cvel_25310.t1-p1 / transcript=Cvel_25310.t1 / gene=Cvel_25310 / organism=Chromera_velia_CCMP2878 / gene_product=LINE-1 reverse transcriptase homolog, putative / transcript_product=LINE-1 reverse transcriptase homolog, putative / location=Cvel_scaffold2848:19919-22582(+) / protein_length=812 / sequence_SO=supercontig / SO=protein_coding / is_pseudo=false
MLQPRRTAHIAEEFHRASVDVAFLQETRIHGETECHERQRLLLAGPPAGSALQGRNGVGFSFSRKAERQKPGVLQQAGNASRIGGAGDEEVAEFYRDLGEAVRKVPNGNPVVIGGDFNARVGERNEETAAVLGRFMEGQRYPNRNGQCLLEFCLEHELVVANSFFQHPPHHKGSWQHPRSKKWHELDYFLVRRRDLSRVCDVRVFRLIDCWSDHRFETAVTIRSVAEATTEDKGTRPAPEWFAETCSQLLPLLEHKKKARVVYENVSRKGETGVESKRREYVRARNAAAQAVRRARNAWWSQKGRELEEAFASNNFSKLHRFWKELQRPQGRPGINAILKEGQKAGDPPLTDAGEVRARFGRFFEGVLNLPSQAVEGVTDRIPQARVEWWMDRIPSRAEVREAVKRLPNGKAAGADSIVAEQLKAGGEAMISRLLDVFRAVWKERGVPKVFRDAVIVPVPKKGDRLLCDNWREIALLIVAGKVLAKIVGGRIQKRNKKKIGESQAGFREGRGTIDMLFTARQIMEKARERQIRLFWLFVDLTKAFDTVNRVALRVLLLKVGIPPLLTESDIIMSFIQDMKACVEVNGERTEPFAVKNGVRQGCVIGSLLFLILFEAVVQEALQGWDAGVEVEVDFAEPFTSKKAGRSAFKISVTDLKFADDLAAPETQERRMQEFADRLQAECDRWGLKISIKKTEMMVQPGRGEEKHTREPRQSTIAIKGQPLQEVEQFRYLGGVMSNDGSLNGEIYHRIQKVGMVWEKLQGEVWKQAGLTTKTKMHMFRGAVLPPSSMGQRRGQPEKTRSGSWSHGAWRV